MTLGAIPQQSDLDEILESGKTIGDAIKSKVSDANHAQEDNEKAKEEKAYTDCLNNIYLQALKINEQSDSTYGEKVGYCGWDESSKTNVDIKKMNEIGYSIQNAYKNGQAKRLSEDLAKQGLQLRFSYSDNSEVNGYANQTLEQLTEFPHATAEKRLNIRVCLK